MEVVCSGLVSILVLLCSGVETLAQEVNTTHGVVSGFRSIVLGQALNVFYGIPFAKPPVGRLRFQHPEHVDPWRPEVKDALAMKPSCQQDIYPAVGQPLRTNPNPISEDCLYLNIWVPSNIPAGTKLATMVWIYGGAFTSGSINVPLYDGRFIAATNNLIVASINYRLGVHGLVYLGSDTFPGNQGMMDQVMGLEWIYKNIERFGGDVNKITIFGESAGAASVGHHLLSPLSKDFFTRAILQSGAPAADWTSMTADTGRKITRKLAELAKCSTVSDLAMFNCIRQLPPETILEIQRKVNIGIITYAPVIDGYFLPDDPSTLLKKGLVKKADILLGVEKDEGTMFLAGIAPTIFTLTNTINVTRTQFIATVNVFASLLGDTDLLPKAIVAQYEATQVASLRDSYADLADDILGDQLFKCPAVQTANWVSRTSKVFLYSHEHIIASLPVAEWLGVMHSFELEFVFGHPLGGNMTVTQEEIDLSRAMMKYWTNFAKTGNPNLPSTQSVNWPKYDVTDERYLVLDVGDDLRVDQGLRKRHCVFWNEIIPLLKKEVPQPSTPWTYPSSGVRVTAVYWISLVACLALFRNVYS